MKISEILNDKKLSVSFEVFPPKTTTVFENVREATGKIAALSPSFVSVTYGAGGGTSRYTLEIAEHIEKTYRVPVLAHLTCVSSTEETVDARIEELKKAGIENIMALRGDLTPELMSGDRSALPFAHATDLIRKIRQHGDFCIGGACYPEVHPESANRADDLRHLLEKVEAGCSFLTTQMFFDNNILYSFLYHAREAGITVPILPGIMPITNANQVERAVKLSGCLVPQRFKSIVDRFGSSPEAMKQAGIAYAVDQIIDLFANGINHVHVYSMNKPDVAEKILAALCDIVGLS